MQSRVKHIIPEKVSKPMKEVLVPVNDPLCESTGCRLSENCCDLGCLSAFNNDEIYQFLAGDDKARKVLLLLGKLRVLSNAGDSTLHACKEGPKRAHVTYNYAFDHRDVCKKALFFFMI